MGWSEQGYRIEMAEGDYGIQLPVTFSGMTLTESDSIRFVFLTAKNGRVLLEKEFTNISDNAVNLVFTEEESAIFTPRTYVYRLDWYQNGLFMCNMIPEGIFKVVDKA